MVDGVNKVRLSDQANPADAVPAHTPDFRGMDVRQIRIFGWKNKNYGDAEAAANHLAEMAHKGNKAAERVLVAALRTGMQHPTNAFAQAAKIYFGNNSSNAQKPGPKIASFPKVGLARQNKRGDLTRLLKTERDGHINSLYSDTDLRTGKTATSEENSLTITKFRKDLEKKWVADIAVAWFEELERLFLDPESDITAKKRVEIQTGLVNVLTKLDRAPICALEKLRESRSSNNSKEFLDVLMSDAGIDDKFVKRLVALQSLFRNERLEELSDAAKNLDAAGMNRIKERQSQFSNLSFDDLLTAVGTLEDDNASWERFKTLRGMFDKASVDVLCEQAKKLKDWHMGPLKFLKLQFPNKKYYKLLDCAYELQKKHLEGFMEVVKLWPLLDTKTQYGGADNLEKFMRMVLEFDKGRLVLIEKVFKRGLKTPHEIYVVLYSLDNKKKQDLFEKIMQDFPDENLKSISFAVSVVSKKENLLDRLYNLKDKFPEVKLDDLAEAVNLLDENGIKRLEKVSDLFAKSKLNFRSFIFITQRLGDEFMPLLERLYHLYPNERRFLLYTNGVKNVKIETFEALKKQFPDKSLEKIYNETEKFTKSLI